MATRRLLVLDDEPDFGAIVRRVGEGLGYETTVLDRSLEFVATYRRIRPDIIFLDVVMPEMDGIEIIRWLNREGNKAKVVLCSGFNPLYVRAAVTQAESGGHFSTLVLSKPIKLGKLHSVLRPEEFINEDHIPSTVGLPQFSSQ